MVKSTYMPSYVLIKRLQIVKFVQCREGYYKWEDQRCSPIYKGTNGGLAVSISACDDHQTSSDTTVSIFDICENQPTSS